MPIMLTSARRDWSHYESATLARSEHAVGVDFLRANGARSFWLVTLARWAWWYSCTGPGAAKTSAPSETREPKHALPEGVESIVNSVGMTLVRVPAGEFIMGLPDEGDDRDDLVHGVPPDVPPQRVRFRQGFYLGAFEVAQGEYERVMGSNPSWHAPEGGGRMEIIDQDPSQFPVEQVSWVDAMTFCCRLSAVPAEKSAGRTYRLPTEAEWEYACRAGSTTPFQVPRDISVDESGFNMRPDGRDGLPVSPVGSYRPNAFGLYDMRGNVFEWCADWYAWDYYEHSPQDDPQGPS
ncbi:MAG: formylglycine-generating enzyme family protein, partial [Planctomycetes bacterium]|nr:formylglycine-generating enzyme family protein [Planctomycetota bacterium]